MPVKFKSELGVTCVVILLCALLLGLGWLMGGDTVLALGNDLARAEQPEATEEAAPADPEPTPADAQAELVIREDVARIFGLLEAWPDAP